MHLCYKSTATPADSKSITQTILLTLTYAPIMCQNHSILFPGLQTRYARLYYVGHALNQNWIISTLISSSAPHKTQAY